MELANELNKLIQEVSPVYSPTMGKVVKVNEDDGICTVSFADGRPVNDRVFLQSILTPDFIVIPAEGSEVIVAFIDNSQKRAFLIKVAKVKKIKWETSPDKKTTIEISDTGLIIENGKGKINLSEDGISIGEGSEPMIKGQSLNQWAATVDAAIAAIITWGATGVAPGGSGGIAPLIGVTPTSFSPDILSKENKLS
ncbi:MAG: hypothetical protein FWH53_00065 [Leptospirales bacterium]|nr:hypothetical protein [Leptospirales bacterium]